MLEDSQFEDFNFGAVRSEEELQTLINVLFGKVEVKVFKKRYPHVSLLLQDTTNFYATEFGDLQNKIVREKRQINFDTPHRAEMQYEYTIEDFTRSTCDLYYLFNTQNRLNWLQCYANGKPIDIASKQTIIQRLSSALDAEVIKLAMTYKIKKEEIYDSLYESSNGKPCFVNLVTLPRQDMLVNLKIRYFGAENRERITGNKLINPIQNKNIKYTYNPLNNKASCWLYVKGPSRFQVSFGDKFEHVEYPKYDDEEILSAVFRAEPNKLFKFVIKIYVPDGLNFWLLATYTLSITAILFLFIISCIRCCGCTFVAKWVDIKLICALIAGIITTRGWLMHDEYILKTLSKAYTWIVISLLLLCLGWMVITGL